MKPIIFEGREVKVGDRMWSVTHGWGEVKALIDDNNYPIRLSHEGKLPSSCYSETGEWWAESGIRCLFWDEVKIVPPTPKTKRWSWAVRGLDGSTVLTGLLSYKEFEKEYPNEQQFVKLDWTEVES